MADVGTIPTADDFRDQLAREFESAEAAGCDHVDIRSGDLHAKLGGYPPKPGENHRMRSCCNVMRAAMGSDDKVLCSPPSCQGANLVIRYRIPR